MRVNVAVSFFLQFEKGDKSPPLNRTPPFQETLQIGIDSWLSLMLKDPLGEPLPEKPIRPGVTIILGAVFSETETEFQADNIIFGEAV